MQMCGHQQGSEEGGDTPCPQLAGSSHFVDMGLATMFL